MKYVLTFLAGIENYLVLLPPVVESSLTLIQTFRNSMVASVCGVGAVKVEVVSEKNIVIPFRFCYKPNVTKVAVSK